jgi:hypothetical protein
MYLLDCELHEMVELAQGMAEDIGGPGAPELQLHVL